MCTCESRINQKDWYGEKKYRLADFFDSWWDTYLESPAEYVKPEQLKAVNAIRVCRTAALGIDVYACPDCGEITNVYHSCKNRFCPTCSWQDTVRWAEDVKWKMLDTHHRHIVCTLPHSLNGLIKRNGLNQDALLSILMRTAADTFKDWFWNKYGLKIGIISVLHTYGEKKDFHCHVHMIVSWAGIDPETGKLKIIEDGYVNYKFFQKKFRCKFEDELIGLFDKNELAHDFRDRQEFMQFVKSINKNNWNIHLEPPMDTPEQVIRYIGRYSKRACLSEYKITNIEGEYITFSYKDNKDRDENKKPIEKELCLHYREFFPRLLQHVPLPNFKIVRYYGLYSNKGLIPEEYRYKEGSEKKHGETSWGELQEEKTGKNPLYCKECGCEKEYIYTIVDLRLRDNRREKFNSNKHRHMIFKRKRKRKRNNYEKRAA